MSNDVQSRAEVLFYEAVELCQAEREAFLHETCGADGSLLREVAELLLAHDAAADFLQVDAPASPELEPEFARLKPEEVGERIGNYKLLERIGEGGFGVVWVAAQEKPMRRQVALKIIKLGMDTRAVIARFEQERQALAMMDHPNIAKVLEAGATDFGRPYFVMELVRGMKITNYCDQANLSTAERLKLFIAVCQAVQHAHQKGIIHRDLKPSNILVTLHDGVPVPKVIDFGVAKATQQQRLTDLTVYTQFEQMIGTPLYMSPEQAEMTRLDIDTRSDIYSLGVLLYELLVGRTPFDPEDLMTRGVDEIRRAVREQNPQKPSTFVSTMAIHRRTNLAQRRQTDAAKLIGQIRGDLDWIVMKALEKDRTRRYETANGLAKDIERHLLNEPVQARPPTHSYRFRRFATRNKVAISAASAVLAALIIGLAASTWMFFKEKRARERAVAAESAQRQERKSAETEASKSRQVAQFLKEMLKGVGPSVALGRDTKMLREILDKTADRVGKDLKDQPEVEADLRSLIGEVYLSLGAIANAEAMQRVALAIREKQLGYEHPEVAASLYNVGNVLADEGRMKEAEDKFREALIMQRKLVGKEGREVGLTMNQLAYAMRAQGKLFEAETVAREALTMNRKLLGSEHPNVAGSLLVLSQAVGHQGRAAESESIHREALVILRKLYGNEHPEVAESLQNLAQVLLQQGKLQEAETASREVLAVDRRMYGIEHLIVADALDTLAHVLWRQDRYTEAETTLREALAMNIKMAGIADYRSATCFRSLVSLLFEQGKLADAEGFVREHLAMERQKLRDDHPEVALTLNDLARVVLQCGKVADAEKIVREAMQMQNKGSAEDKRALSDSLSIFANVVEAQGDVAEAEASQHEALAIARAMKSVRLIEDRLYDLAEFYRHQDRYSDAEPVYREIVQLLRTRRAIEHEDVLAAMAGLARLLTDGAWSEGDKITTALDGNSNVTRADAQTRNARGREAEWLLREVLETQLRVAQWDVWRIDETRSRLGGAMVLATFTDRELGGEARDARFAKAEELLMQANDALKSNPKVQSKYKHDSLTRLVRLYQAWGKSDKTADWQQRLTVFDKDAPTEARQGGRSRAY